jgi:phage virion morphogenesis protein
MNDDLQQLELWAASLLAKVEPAGRRRIARTIAVALRRSQSQRIAMQKSPDGSSYPPRRKRAEALRSRRGQLRRKGDAMFSKLRTARWLKTAVTSEGAEVGFYGRVARLARVHQEGLTDNVSSTGPSVRYAQRVLLGFTPEDREMIRDLLLKELAS